MNVQDLEKTLRRLVETRQIKAWSNTGYAYEINMGPQMQSGFTNDVFYRFQGWVGVAQWLIETKMIPPESTKEEFDSAPKKRSKKGLESPDTAPGVENSEHQ